METSSHLSEEELLGQAMCEGGSPFRQPFRGQSVKIRGEAEDAEESPGY
jgi:hypothetical protein